MRLLKAIELSNAYLSSDLPNNTWQVMILALAVLCPWGKVPHFSIIPVVRKPHLRSNKENFSVINNNATVIDNILVDDGPVAR